MAKVFLPEQRPDDEAFFRERLHGRGANCCPGEKGGMNLCPGRQCAGCRQQPLPARLQCRSVLDVIWRERITTNPLVMGGKPCIRGMRVTAGMILGMLAAGHSQQDILRLYPYLEQEDIRAALAFAAWRARYR